MTIIDRILRRDMAAPVAAPRRRDVPGGVAGADSAASTYGFLISDDPNPIWRGRSRWPVIDEMRLSDGTVRSSLMLYKLPIRAADYAVEPATEDPLDRLVADAVAWQFGIGRDDDDAPLGHSWETLLDEGALKMLDNGSMFEEMVWGDGLQTWRDADGDPHQILTLIRLAPRSPRFVQRLESDPRTGAIARFEQWLPGTKPIPPEKLIAHAIERENGEWWGTSALRPMYGNWKLKKQLMIASGIAWDRWAAGIPIVRHPSGAGYALRADEIGRTVRGNERAYVTFDASEPDWGLELLNGSGTIADPVPLLRWHCEQIRESGLQFFANLGTSATGSRAVGDVLVDPFYQAVETITKQAISVYRKSAIRRFVDYNFGTAIPTPTITFRGLAQRDVAVLCQAIYDASGAGLAFDDPETQDAIRTALDLPKLPVDFKPPEGAGPEDAEVDPETGLPVPPEAVPPTPSRAIAGARSYPG